jgi:UDP-N-acetylmuramate dehydrogenase
VPAHARFAAEVTAVEQLDSLLADPRVAGLPLLALGAGTNVLFAGDYPGLVIRMRVRGWREEERQPGRVALTAAAGEGWPQLVRAVVERDWYGVENLTDIPGSVGAAPVQNIGAYGSELADVVESVHTYDLDTGARAALSRQECQFRYRGSVFKAAETRALITAITLALATTGSDAPRRLEYPGVAAELAAIGAADLPTSGQISEAIGRLRRRKLPDPVREPNAGSFFKNPIVPLSEFIALQEAHGAPGWPQVPVAPGAAPTHAKLSAAWLIEQCGLRGARFGKIRVSEQHALVLVNDGCRNGAEVLAAAARITAAVDDRFQVSLEPEVRVVAADPESAT